MTIDPAENCKKIDHIIAAFDAYCKAAVNVTYERYVFCKRMQGPTETFDNFYADVRRLAATCAFETVADSMTRDRLVVGIYDDVTRQKLLQIRDLTLKRAVDLCRASEAASQQLRAMTSPPSEEAVAAAAHRDNRRHTGKKNAGPAKRQTQVDSRSQGKRKCYCCGRSHTGPREKVCPAYGQTCSNCHKRNHFASVCKSVKNEVQAAESESDDYDGGYDGEEALLALSHEQILSASGDTRWYAQLSIHRRRLRFLLDSGATVNMLPEKLVTQLGMTSEVKPSMTSLRMYNKEKLHTTGVIKLPVYNPKTGTLHNLNFFVTSHDQPTRAQRMRGLTPAQSD
jgi:hypothetical protein